MRSLVSALVEIVICEISFEKSYSGAGRTDAEQIFDETPDEQIEKRSESSQEAHGVVQVFHSRKKGRVSKHVQ
jgi:hypothetical protein